MSGSEHVKALMAVNNNIVEHAISILKSTTWESNMQMIVVKVTAEWRGGDG